MSFLPSLPADAVLVNVFQRFPEVSSKLIEYHEVLMRGPSPLSVGERELIAGFVSSSMPVSTAAVSTWRQPRRLESRRD